MAVRPMKVWNAATSTWDDVAVSQRGDVILNALVNAKGDLITATANDTPAILTAGSNGQMLMADSSATAGLRYVDPPANRNLVINGAMQLAQRSTSVTGITSSTGAYQTVDRYALAVVSLGTWTQTVENDGPSGSGLNKSLKMLCTTASTSPAANGAVYIDYKMEGQDVQRVRKGTASAEQLTLSFWVKANVTGTYIAMLYDADNSRHVSASYTVSASATWERKTITFPADTTGAFDNDNGSSLWIRMWLASGTNNTSGTLATTWASFTGANSAVGQTNLGSATNNYWQVTGVQLETGPVATPFEFEPYEATLRKCQRYYYLHASGNGDFVSMAGYPSATVIEGYVYFPTTMRTAPSLVATSGTDYYRNAASAPADTFNSLTLVLSQENAALMRNSTEASGTALAGGQEIRTNNNSSSIAFSAEL